MNFILALLLACCSLSFCFASEFQASKYAFRQFMNWYFPSSGSWIGHASYDPDWTKGNGVEALANYYLYNEESLSTAEKDYIWQVLLDVKSRQGTKFYQTAEYFDDILWWSLAYSRAYEIALKRNDKNTADYFLTQSQGINDVVFKDAWTTDYCQGGVFWSRAFSYKNAITNELYLVSSARLAHITNDQRFFDRFNAELEWFLNSGMMQSNYLILDGLDDKCKTTGIAYTYNQGVILGGLVEVNRLSPNSSLIQLGENIVNAVMTLMTDSNKILGEPSCGDGALFKGIFTRYLRYFLELSATKHSDEYNEFMVNQTLSVWQNDQDKRNGYFGKYWAGPYQYNYYQLQIAALDLFTSTKKLSETAMECGPHGISALGACSCFARFSGSNCQTETKWSEYYAGAILSFTSMATNQLFCVNSNGDLFASLSDSSVDSSFLSVEKVDDNKIRLKSTKFGTYLFYDHSSSRIKAVSASDSDKATNSAFHFTPVTSSQSNALGQEFIYLQTADGHYVETTQSYATATSFQFRATNFAVNLKQDCQ